MPRLKQLSCHIEFGSPNHRLREYNHNFTDGAVEVAVAVPEIDRSFQIRLSSKGYIAPGLAAYVFIDGEYQSNRNRVGLSFPTPDADPREYEVDFLFRQKEEKRGGGNFVGREWRFAKLLQAKHGKDNPRLDKRFRDNVGNIEVIVLRCRADDGLADSDRNLPPGRHTNAAATAALAAQPAARNTRKSMRFEGFADSDVCSILDGLDDQDGASDDSQAVSSDESTLKWDSIMGIFRSSSSAGCAVHNLDGTDDTRRHSSASRPNKPSWKPSRGFSETKIHTLNETDDDDQCGPTRSDAFVPDRNAAYPTVSQLHVQPGMHPFAGGQQPAVWPGPQAPGQQGFSYYQPHMGPRAAPWPAPQYPHNLHGNWVPHRMPYMMHPPASGPAPCAQHQYPSHGDQYHTPQYSNYHNTVPSNTVPMPPYHASPLDHPDLTFRPQRQPPSSQSKLETTISHFDEKGAKPHTSGHESRRSRPSRAQTLGPQYQSHRHTSPFRTPTKRSGKKPVSNASPSLDPYNFKEGAFLTPGEIFDRACAGTSIRCQDQDTTPDLSKLRHRHNESRTAKNASMAASSEDELRQTQSSDKSYDQMFSNPRFRALFQSSQQPDPDSLSYLSLQKSSSTKTFHPLIHRLRDFEQLLDKISSEHTQAERMSHELRNLTLKSRGNPPKPEVMAQLADAVSQQKQMVQTMQKESQALFVFILDGLAKERDRAKWQTVRDYIVARGWLDLDDERLTWNNATEANQPEKQADHNEAETKWQEVGHGETNAWDCTERGSGAQNQEDKNPVAQNDEWGNNDAARTGQDDAWGDATQKSSKGGQDKDSPSGYQGWADESQEKKEDSIPHTLADPSQKAERPRPLAERAVQTFAGHSHDTDDKGPQRVIKSYWAYPGRTHRGHQNTGPLLRNPYVYPAPPIPTLPRAKKTQKDAQSHDNDEARSHIDHVVQIGPGADYMHSTNKPVYLDSMNEPYAIFTFKYRSPKSVARDRKHQEYQDQVREKVLSSFARDEALMQEEDIARKGKRASWRSPDKSHDDCWGRGDWDNRRQENASSSVIFDPKWTHGDASAIDESISGIRDSEVHPDDSASHFKPSVERRSSSTHAHFVGDSGMREVGGGWVNGF